MNFPLNSTTLPLEEISHTSMIPTSSPVREGIKDFVSGHHSHWGLSRSVIVIVVAAQGCQRQPIAHVLPDQAVRVLA